MRPEPFEPRQLMKYSFCGIVESVRIDSNHFHLGFPKKSDPFH